jgi:2-keto-4-pentenoate hydratase
MSGQAGYRHARDPLREEERLSKEEEACAILWRHWQAGTVIDALPADLAPPTREAGYAIQACFERHSASPRAGWKIAATSAAGQRHINVEGPLAGRILAERVLPGGATVSLEGNRMRVCEPEFAFRFGVALPARSAPRTVDAVMATVSDLHLSLELPDSRYSVFTRVGAAALIADDGCARDLVLGPAVTADWRGIDLVTHKVRGRVIGGPEREGVGANVLGDPRVALTWLVNEVAALGIDIEAGEFVTTGTCLPPLEIAPGDRVEADYGVLGTIAVTIAG